MIFQGIWPIPSSGKISVGDALLISLIAIVLVFLVLVIIILATSGISKGMEKVEAKTHILPKEENKLLNEDEDAVIAALVATIDYHKETGKNAKLISITRIDEE